MDAENNDVIATVGDLVDHLKKFDRSQKLCFWDEGGAYMNCEHVTKDMIGTFMFVSVADQKQQRLDNRVKQQNAKKEDWPGVTEALDEDYEFVNNDDVVVY